MSRDFPSPPGVSEQVALQAVEFLVDLQTGENPDAVKHQLSLWRQQHPEHEQAWCHIEKVNGHFASLTGLPDSGIVRDPILQGGSMSRRDSVKALTVLLFAGGGSWMAVEQLPWRSWSADHRTAVGQQKALTFAGQQLILNTDSAVNLQQTPGQVPTVHLVEGEILLSPANGTSAAADVKVTARALDCYLLSHNAEFSLYQHKHQCRLSVLTGRVDVMRGVYSEPSMLASAKAGEQLMLRGDQLLARSDVEPDSLAWLRGMLVASSMRLDDFLAEVSRYRSGKLRCAEEIAALRVSGSYPLQDTDRILAALENALPVKMQYLTRYFVTVQPA